MQRSDAAAGDEVPNAVPEFSDCGALVVRGSEALLQIADRLGEATETGASYKILCNFSGRLPKYRVKSLLERIITRMLKETKVRFV